MTRQARARRPAATPAVTKAPSPNTAIVEVLVEMGYHTNGAKRAALVRARAARVASFVHERAHATPPVLRAGVRMPSWPAPHTHTVGSWAQHFIAAAGRRYQAVRNASAAAAMQWAAGHSADEDFIAPLPAEAEAGASSRWRRKAAKAKPKSEPKVAHSEFEMMP